MTPAMTSIRLKIEGGTRSRRAFLAEFVSVVGQLPSAAVILVWRRQRRRFAQTGVAYETIEGSAERKPAWSLVTTCHRYCAGW
jgi:hypothetical protein